jgi:hypothetical protein
MKEIPEHPGYFVDEQGNVFSVKSSASDGKGTRTLHPLKKFIWNRYQAVLFCEKGKEKKHKVAYLVLITFVGPRPFDQVIRHGANGILDDSLQNLCWGTRHENEQDKRRDGTYQIGEGNPRAKANEIQVRIIRRAYSPHGRDGGFSARELSKIFGFNEGLIQHIATRRTWKHI